MSHLASFPYLLRVAHAQYRSGTREKMVAGKDKVYELKCKRALQLSWKEEFSWVALEDVGETPD